MNKRKLKIEALEIASDLCNRVDVCLWEDEKQYSEFEQEQIVKFIHEIGEKISKQANKMKKMLTNCST